MLDNHQLIREDLIHGKTSLGIEFGSTRIKAVLIGSTFDSIATGSYEWENRLENGMWTYSLEEVWKGLQSSYRELTEEVVKTYGLTLNKIGSIGISGMMHGYLVFNQQAELLVPFRTWRNSTTAEAEKILTKAFNYNIPQRWSIAHLYQAILNQESHLQEITYLTTLAGYLHWQLTDQKVLGVGDASGMFPIDNERKTYDQKCVAVFEQLVSQQAYPWEINTVLPKVLVAGEIAGKLTARGAKLLDSSGQLEAGIPFCPPEGDAGTGMVATNAVAERTGNISAGTSVFAMVVLEKALKKVYPEIDLVATPTGSLVAMVHANNCSSEINAWVTLFGEFATVSGNPLTTEQLFTTLFNQALLGAADGGGLLTYGYHSGENITHMSAGRPLFVRSPDSQFNLANLMRTHLLSAFGALKIGMDILLKEEGVQLERIVGHGGLFTTAGVAQKLLAGAIKTPVSVMETAAEGGAWGIALLAAYARKKKTTESLATFLTQQVFIDNQGTTLSPTAEDVAGFEQFMERYQTGLPIEQAALDHLI